ncbi:MAG: hypothetical protein IRZ31_08715 [Thermogemmatispora sp.]|uniref:Uncharacterized protein n=1 Tax=Thermogemmatispora tikiterensis TaxID=1825093 RepID=A0A328VPZ2_9CHLR|nr:MULTISPECIES: hypothetical protein [Thermogemmatispora]MBX5456969.1 hypothetical protein [Thermogemmatispora sp.]RAQ97753.1 hypothetical protein A4R35_19595 [Thermogemmatispora tikiterensis]
MIGVLVDYLMGPLGRALESAYLTHSLPIGLLLLVWMGVVCWGLRGVIRLRQQLRRWVQELLPAYDPAQPETPQQLLQALEPRWQEAAARVRFMPTHHGLWIRRATPEALRAEVGFTTEGLARLLARLAPRSAAPRQPHPPVRRLRPASATNRARR